MLLVAGREPGSDLSAWVSGSDLEMGSAFREPTTLPLVVRAVEKGGARVGKTDLYPLLQDVRHAPANDVRFYAGYERLFTRFPHLSNLSLNEILSEMHKVEMSLEQNFPELCKATDSDC